MYDAQLKLVLGQAFAEASQSFILKDTAREALELLRESTIEAEEKQGIAFQIIDCALPALRVDFLMEQRQHPKTYSVAKVEDKILETIAALPSADGFAGALKFMNALKLSEPALIKGYSAAKASIERADENSRHLMWFDLLIDPSIKTSEAIHSILEGKLENSIFGKKGAARYQAAREVRNRDYAGSPHNIQLAEYVLNTIADLEKKDQAKACLEAHDDARTPKKQQIDALEMASAVLEHADVEERATLAFNVYDRYHKKSLSIENARSNFIDALRVSPRKDDVDFLAYFRGELSANDPLAKELDAQIKLVQDPSIGLSPTDFMERMKNLHAPVMA